VLSEKVKELIGKSRIVSFRNWQNYPSEVIALFQAADDRGEYLRDEEIAQIEQIVPELTPYLTIVRILRDSASTIITQARAEVLSAFPDIIEVGGALYPPERAEACWRDFWHFLRCITYGIGGNSTDYLSLEGLGYMEQLYRELKVPLDAMAHGLEKLREYSLLELAKHDSSIDVAAYFNRTIDSFKEFRA
jgi:allophycocyanin-B